MSLARFYSRINEAISPLLSGIDDLEAFLSERIVCLEAPDDLEAHPVHLAGFVLATNLCARLYPRLRLIGPDRVVSQCRSVIEQINPLCEVEAKLDECHGGLSWAVRPSRDNFVVVAPVGWEVQVDLEDSSQVQQSNILVSLAAATIGVGEVFRSVFAPFLRSGRSQPSPGRLNVLTLDESSQAQALPGMPSNVEIGRVHLAGAGAIGQAFIYTLARTSIRGTLVVVDPESISLSNLQRYILANDSDVDLSKCSLVARALRSSSLQVICIEDHWERAELSTNGPVEVVCTSVDSARVRMGIQSGLPQRIYNGWTQPADLGWSRHENFGVDPCLACLYWPNRPLLNEHELIAKATRQDELRVLGYLTYRPTVDQPLQPEQIPRIPDLPLPTGSAEWTERSILDDIIASLGIDIEHRRLWQGKELRDLYREGICGGALISKETADVPQEMAVPLAHQSVLAGIMLTAQLLIDSSPELRPFRAQTIEARFDVLAGFPQSIGRPRQRTQNCICSDRDFLERYQSKWQHEPFIHQDPSNS
jgi:hypothetical protein